MKLSQSFMKLVIKLLILMMLFVIMFMISSFLYSARYWPDVYNYINANITIKRIPTISELELTVIEVDFTTEMYSTTDVDYLDMSTIDDFDIDEFMKDEFDLKTKTKRNIGIEQVKDYIELPSRGIFVDYVFLEQPINQEATTERKEEEIEYPNEHPDNISKTSVTGVVIEDRNAMVEVSEEPAVTRRYYTVQDSINKETKRAITEPTTRREEATLEARTETFIEHTTTVEGYLVGDDNNTSDRKVTEEPITLTTKIENELVNEDFAPGYMKDSVDVSKLSTRGSGDVEMFTKKPEKIQMMTAPPVCHGEAFCNDFSKTVFPWVVTIFITNSTKESQFSYYCDGALLSDKVIITDARCMIISGRIWAPEDVLVFLGKGNLQSFGSNEKVQKVKEVIVHPNYTFAETGKVTNDLALLVLEDAVEFKDNIKSACFHHDMEKEPEEAITTAWGINGALETIVFNNQKSDNCFDQDDDIFCATYGNEVALCPSFGGVYAIRRAGRWCLQGIFYGDPADRGICFNKNVYFTSLKNYSKWIDDNVDNRNDLL